MQTNFTKAYSSSPEGRKANQILRSCVHCGFCTATCPTYLLSGNELDSPRGRIYLIKKMLEGEAISKVTQTHLDRCLSCMSCETTCPSSVNYHDLLSIGRKKMESNTTRSLHFQIKRRLVIFVLQNKRVFSSLLALGRFFRPLLPLSLKHKIPKKTVTVWPQEKHPRKMLILNGCVQGSLSPNTNAAIARVLDKLGIELVSIQKEGCCGALSFHLNKQEEGKEKAKKLIDTLYEEIQGGAEAIISSATGCGSFIQQYSSIFSDDLKYKERTELVCNKVLDISEVLVNEPLDSLTLRRRKKLSYHCPCSMQHGLSKNHDDEKSRVPTILEGLGFELGTVRNAHLCCGSAGAYSLFQKDYSQKLKSQKISALEESNPDAIATSNIGCQYHLAEGESKEVKHWVEFVDEAIQTVEETDN